MSNDDYSHPAYQRIIYESQIQMQEARSLFWSDRAENAVTRENIQLLQASLMRYFDALRRYRTKPIIKTEWEEGGFDRLKDVALSERPVETRSPGRSSKSDTQTAPAMLDPHTIIEMSYALDDIATELGFAAPVGEKVAELDEAIV